MGFMSGGDGYYSVRPLTDLLIKEILQSSRRDSHVKVTASDGNIKLFDFCFDVPKLFHVKNKKINVDVGDIQDFFGYKPLNISGSLQRQILSLRTKDLNRFDFFDKDKCFLGTTLDVKLIRLGKVSVDDCSSLLSVSKLLLALRYGYFNFGNDFNVVKLIADKRKAQEKSGVFFEIRKEYYPNCKSVDLGVIFSLTKEYMLMINHKSEFNDVSDVLIDEFLKHVFFTIVDSVSVNSGFHGVSNISGAIVECDEVFDFRDKRIESRKDIAAELSLQDDFGFTSEPIYGPLTIFSDALVVPDQNFYDFQGVVKVPNIAYTDSVIDQEVVRKMDERVGLMKDFIKNHCSEGWKENKISYNG